MNIVPKIQQFYKGKPKNYTGFVCAIYYFLASQVERQKTLQVYCTDSFIQKGLGFGRDVLTRAKKDMKEMGLIEIIKTKKDGKFGKSYIKVNYIEATFSKVSELKEAIGNRFIPDEREELVEWNGQELEICVNGYFVQDGKIFQEIEVTLTGETRNVIVSSNELDYVARALQGQAS